MPTIGTLGKYKVKIHVRDHNPPHVHFESGGLVVRVDIGNIAIMSIEGSPTRRELRIMLDYVGRNQEFLMEAWNEFQE